MRNVIQYAAICAVLFGAIAASADTITFQPTPNNLGDLEHQQYYTWGIDWNLPAGQQVTSATLAIDNINDWQVEDGDILYMHLLDNPPAGVHQYTDNEGGGDAFAGQGTLLTTFTDDDPEPNPPEDFSYSFTAGQIAALTSYDSNGRIGLGFDPDCHYYNDGISLTIATAAIPEPATALLMSLIGLVVLPLRRRLHQAA